MRKRMMILKLEKTYLEMVYSYIYVYSQLFSSL